jgi:hypothetical protein
MYRVGSSTSNDYGGPSDVKSLPTYLGAFLSYKLVTQNFLNQLFNNLSWSIGHFVGYF